MKYTFLIISYLLLSLSSHADEAKTTRVKRKFKPKIKSVKRQAQGDLAPKESSGGIKASSAAKLEVEETLSQLIDKIFAAHSNYTIENKRVAPSHIIAENAKKTFENIYQLLQNYIESQKKILSNESLWVPKAGNIWKAEDMSFQPYARRKLLDEKSRNFFFGDFHGDIKTLGFEL